MCIWMACAYGWFVTQNNRAHLHVLINALCTQPFIVHAFMCIWMACAPKTNHEIAQLK